ncbi:hypothetical protein ARALYDRAFT_903284 [Arabidopsis lyrata subsp. lyrata]|uniref:Translation elongation factor EF1B beta/delta subunit guanine nucleotide exchange domain-containing protein n=1 Tax=Arabidopsis lyrata subsp. lyrata TaxID=81972 RepID=D7LEG0_ARALL|nr:hypothetical protein ARALYDRAFT_903284 [Arabidopsis lyrata subsp. lyrata]
MVTFPNLNSDAGLKKLDEYLLTRYYISSYKATKDDIIVYGALLKPPTSQYVNACRWYNHMEILLRRGISFNSSEGSGVIIDGSSAVDSKKAAEERRATSLETSTKKETWKSTLMVIIPPDDEMDMEKLEKDVRSIQMEGLVWGPSKLFPVGYGVKLLRIIFIHEEDLCDDDTLVDTHIYNCGRVRSVETCNLEVCPAKDDGDLLEEEIEEEKKASGKSGLVVFRYGGKTDIQKVEERVRSKQKEGVSWGATKLFNVGYGFTYFQTIFTIVDDRVSLDTIRRKGLRFIPLNRICKCSKSIFKLLLDYMLMPKMFVWY